MAETQALPTGFTAAQSLAKLLEGSALGPSLRPFTEAPTHAQPQEALTLALEALGHTPRWVQLIPPETEGLRLPSLVLLPDRTFLVLRDRHRGRVRVEAPGGVFLLAASRLPKGLYLDGLGPLPGTSLWRNLASAILAHRRTWTQCLALAALAQIPGLAFPQFTRIMVDRVFPGEAHSLFGLIVLSMAAAGAYQAGVSWIQRQFEVTLELRLAFEMEAGFLGHLLRLPFPWLSRRTMGDLLQGFFGMGAARQFLIRHVSGDLLSNLSLPFFVVSMARTSAMATLAVLGGAAIQTGATFLLGRRLARLEALGVATHVKERSLLVEMLRGIGVIKASGSEAMLGSRWLDLVRNRRCIELEAGRLHLLAQTLIEASQGLLLQAVILGTSILFLKENIRLGEMLAFGMMATSFQGGLARIAGLFLQLARLRPTLGKVEEILAVAREPAPFPVERNATPPFISIRDLWFRYEPEGAWVLKAFQAEVAPGERILLQGPSGCGKSSLLKVLAGIQEPDRGQIRMGGLRPREARSQTVYLPQTTVLFSGSLLENLSLLSGGAPREALLAMTEKTGLADIIRSLPMGFETVVAQGGHNFSGGQRQLIALTAALASSRSLLLLDEAMAHMDALGKERLLAGDPFQGKTVLLVSHEDTEGPMVPGWYGFRRERVQLQEPLRYDLSAEGNRER